MKHLTDTYSTDDYRQNFAAELAALSGAEQVCMGFFHCADRQFTESWSGAVAGVSGPQTVPLDADICRILTGLQSGGPDYGFVADRVRSEGYLIGIGPMRDQLVPVIALCGGPAEDDARLARSLTLGLSYVTQQLDEMAAEAPLSMDAAIETALGVLSINLAVVDAYGEIDYCTDFTTDWLEEYGGFEINLRRLGGKTQKLQKTFHQALALATGPSPQASIVPIDVDKRLSRIAVVMPLEHSNPPRALVILEQGNKDPELGDHLLKLSGLTNSECRIAHHLLEGKSLNEIADVTNLSLSTVRSYLKGIFAKTSTHRQGQFITYFHNTVPRVKYIPAIGERPSKPAR